MDYDDNGNLLFRQPPHTDPYNGLTGEERMLSGCLQGAMYVLAIVIGLILCVLIFGSCATTEYVPVIEKHENHHWHTDSVTQKDSVYHEKNTTIMQLDSDAMAKYGIQLKSAERAWLVQTSELERRIQELARIVQEKDSVHDSIPVPYPVTEYVEKELTWWQQLRIHLGGILIFLALIYAFIKWGIPIIKRLL